MEEGTIAIVTGLPVVKIEPANEPMLTSLIILLRQLSPEEWQRVEKVQYDPPSVTVTRLDGELVSFELDLSEVWGGSGE
jgi:hypothetical protein